MNSVIETIKKRVGLLIPEEKLCGIAGILTFILLFNPLMKLPFLSSINSETAAFVFTKFSTNFSFLQTVSVFRYISEFQAMGNSFGSLTLLKVVLVICFLMWFASLILIGYGLFDFIKNSRVDKFFVIGLFGAAVLAVILTIAGVIFNITLRADLGLNVPTVGVTVTTYLLVIIALVGGITAQAARKIRTQPAVIPVQQPVPETPRVGKRFK